MMMMMMMMGMLLTVASGHWTHPARDHREPQGTVQHRCRSDVSSGRGQQPSRHAASSAVHQLRDSTAVVVLGRRRGCSTARGQLRVRPGWLRRGPDEEEIARTAARVDIVEY